MLSVNLVEDPRFSPGSVWIHNKTKQEICIQMVHQEANVMRVVAGDRIEFYIEPRTLLNIGTFKSDYASESKLVNRLFKQFKSL